MVYKYISLIGRFGSKMKTFPCWKTLFGHFDPYVSKHRMFFVGSSKSRTPYENEIIWDGHIPKEVPSIIHYLGNTALRTSLANSFPHRLFFVGSSKSRTPYENEIIWDGIILYSDIYIYLNQWDIACDFSGWYIPWGTPHLEHPMEIMPHMKSSAYT